jgi:hypothetical protein
MSWELLLPYAAWLGNTSFGQWLGASTWRIASLLAVHLFGLTMLLGSVVVTSLRLLGLFQRWKPVPQLRREIRPVMLTGLCVSFATGALIFTGGAEAYYSGYWFRLKMVLLALTLIFHFTVFRVVTSSETGRVSRVGYGLTGAATLALWFGVAWAGRAIAFF